MRSTRETIKRIAVLIGCPGMGPSSLRGVHPDIRNMYQYHRSPRGGAWLPEEIIVLWSPTREQLLDIIGGIEADFLRVYFSGHGCADLVYDRTPGVEGIVDVRMLALSGNDLVCDLELVNWSIPRQEIICDCCRLRPGARISGIPETFEEIPFTEEEFYEARELFNKYIQLSPEGKVIIHSTLDGEPAADTDAGGTFTFALLESALNYQSTHRNMPAGLDLMLDRAARQLSKSCTQCPEIIYLDGHITVPFALNTAWPGTPLDGSAIPGRERHMQLAGEPTIRPINGWLAVGVILFGAWLVSET